MENLIIREAIQLDILTLTELLSAADLIAQDVLAPGTIYWLANDKHDQLVGSAGWNLVKRQFC